MSSILLFNLAIRTQVRINSKFDRKFDRPNQLHNRYKFAIKLLTSSILLSGTLLVQSARAKEPFEGYTTSPQSATSSSYTGTNDGQSYTFGNGNDLNLESITDNDGVIYTPKELADEIFVRRVDNSQVSGERCNIFLERSGSGTGDINSDSTFPTDNNNCSIVEVLRDLVVNRGVLDVFSNATPSGSEVPNNIERVDFVFTAGIQASPIVAELDEAGHIVMEKSGNNPVKVAAITAIDGAGNPTAFSNTVVTINVSDYGVTGSNINNNFLVDASTTGGVTNPEFTRQSNEKIGGVLVTLTDFGIGAGDIYYGFAMFGTDVDENTVDLLQPQTFPQNTPHGVGATGGADWQGGMGGFWSSPQYSTTAISDYGDTPNNYNNGDSGEHLTTASSGLYLGTVAPDGETSPQNSTDAEGDDNSGDDEDAITSFPTLDTSTSSYSLTATVNNSGSSAANVYGWIDFDRDGQFDQDERASVSNGTIALDVDGKVPSGSRGTVTLNWSDIGDPGANIINGTSYVRIRTTTDDLSAAGQSTTRDSASVDAANNGEIEDFQLTINYSPLVEQSYCESIGGTINTTNLFTELDSGTFGIGTSENESSSINSDLTTYTYNANYPPNDGQYSVSTRRTDVGFNTWHTMTGHTTGDETDRFMVINANEDIADTEMIQSRYISGLTPNTNYTFTAYILNTVEVNPATHIDPNVSYGIDLEGIDDDGDGTIDEDREVEIRFSSGDIPESSQPTWVPYSFLFNTGDATSARFIIRNNVIGGSGNDLAIDDITLRGCDLTTGNLSGTLYYDTNSNGSLDNGEPGLPPGLTVRLIDDRGTPTTDDDIIVTRLANPGGSFSFLNIPVGSNYRLEAPGDDGSGNAISTTNPLTNIAVTANNTTSNLNFGYLGVGDDYGDAPIDYDDTADNDVIDGGDDPARHTLSSNLYLGSVAADADTPPLNSSDANQDDNNLATDDEEAFTSLPEIPLTGNYDLTVPVHNTSTSNATLHAWIDFDQDGKFEAGEYQSVVVNINATSANLSWTIPSGLSFNDTTYARFRLTRDTLSDDSSTADLDERAVGAVSNGEVEDYQVAVESSVSSLAGQLVINEVLYDQTPPGNVGADANDEFIELLNISSSSIDLSGFQLIDGNLLVNYDDDNDALDGTTGSITGSQVPYIFPSGTVLQPGEYAVIWIGDQNDGTGAQIADRFADGAAFQAWLGSSPSLNNSGDDVWLYDADTKIIDYMAYGLESSGAINTRPTANIWDSTYENRLDNGANGQSISLTPNGVDGDSSSCWEKTAIAVSESDSASGRCSGYLATTDTDTGFLGNNQRVTSVGRNNNGQILDYGDAPAAYEDSNEARHAIISSLYFGAVAPDEETAAQSSTDADGDNNNGEDDETGISSFPTLDTDDTSYSLTVAVENISGAAANVYGWIDFDNDGEFDEDEKATVADGTITLVSGQVPSGSSGTVTLNWSNIGSSGANISTGNSFVRIRLTSDELDTTTETTERDDASIGIAGDGEVEDYQIAIAASSSNTPPTVSCPADYDLKTFYWDDTASSSPTAEVLFWQPGSRNNFYNINGNLLEATLTEPGSNVLFENTDTFEETFDPQDSGIQWQMNSSSNTQSETFTLEFDYPLAVSQFVIIDIDASSGSNPTSWHDAITFAASNSGTSLSATLTPANPNKVTVAGNTAFAADGVGTTANSSATADADVTITTADFADELEIVFNNGPRSQSNPSSHGIGIGSFVGCFPRIDFGDAPDASDGTSQGDYQTRTVDDGARHRIVTGISLGDSVDADSGTLHNTNATADDDDNVNDDDGVLLDGSSLQSEDLTRGESITLDITTQGSGVLNAWIDWDHDGDFLGLNEQIATNAVENGTGDSDTGTPGIQLEVTVPTGATIGSTFARFRYSSDLDLTPTGKASDGEVEDYQIAIANTLLCPTARADLWFANDESGSVENDEFEDSLDFLYQLSDQFEYGETAGIKAGIIGWASNPPNSGNNNIIIPITDTFGDPDDTGLISDGSIDTSDIDTLGVREQYTSKKVPLSDSGTRLDRATNYLSSIITTANGRRANTPQVAIILTDANESQITISYSDGSSRWEAAARDLKDPDDGPGASIVLIIIGEAADAYNAGGNAKTIIDNVVGADGQLLIVPTYTQAADATQGYIEQAAQAVCDSTNPVATDPELLLTKRITAINPGQTDEVTFSDFVDDDSDADNNAKWPNSSGDSGTFTNTYTVGTTNGGEVIPGDILEYTIYFLSSGDEAASNVLVCDLIPANTELVTNDFDTVTPAAGGTSGLERGLVWEYNGNLESLTNDQDGDAGYYFPPGIEPSTVFPNVQCSDSNLPNSNGAVVVELGDVPHALTSGNPTNSFGFLRFRVRVK